MPIFYLLHVSNYVTTPFMGPFVMMAGLRIALECYDNKRFVIIVAIALIGTNVKDVKSV